MIGPRETMGHTAEYYRQRVRRDHLNRGLVQANRHIAEARLNVAKQVAIIDGLDRHGHDSALATDLLAILHKTLQMHEDHRERIIRELELGPASIGGDCRDYTLLAGQRLERRPL